MLQQTLDQKSIVQLFFEHGILLSPSFFSEPREVYLQELLSRFEQLEEKPDVMTDDVFLLLREGVAAGWRRLDNARVAFEQGRDAAEYLLLLDLLRHPPVDVEHEVIAGHESAVEGEHASSLVVVQHEQEKPKKREVEDFVKYFTLRYGWLRELLMQRIELRDAVSIHRVLGKEQRSNVAIIGMVKDKRETKNGNLIFCLEDLSGEIQILVSKSRGELFEIAADVVVDEVLGVLGITGEGILFASNIVYPDIPAGNELKKYPEEAHLVFTSDLHVGSGMFYEEHFLRFVAWLNGETGNEQQKEVARRVEYLFLVGDLVDGVGIYPGQEEDLVIKDIYEQYDKLASLLQRIREDVQIIAIGGNHDALRLSEPQPALNRKYAPRLFSLPNFTWLSNPCMLKVYSREDFPGFTVLMYHGGSFPYFAEHVTSIRKAGRLDRADLIMKFLLQRRHLAPSHGSTLYIPDAEKDALLIRDIPDFLVTGHIHKTQAMHYRGVTLLGCGCWTGQTEDQVKRGIMPDPSRVTLVNLLTREVRILNFGD